VFPEFALRLVRAGLLEDGTQDEIKKSRDNTKTGKNAFILFRRNFEFNIRVIPLT
jgi:hypothetical protein